MAKTQSQMLPLGTLAPDFRLRDGNGATHGLTDNPDARGYLVVFMCNHCPYVQHVREELAKLGEYCASVNIAMFGINSNDADAYPDDSPAKMVEEARARKYRFPYLVDEDQSVAKAYHAACTPEFYLFDKDRRLAYRGQLDDSRPHNDITVTGKDLREAMAAMLDGRSVSQDQKPSLGCNIKWKPGNAPEWFG